MEKQTCGKGLAEHSVLPAKVADLIASLAQNLEIHMKALDLNDENSKKEHDAYRELAQQHRTIAAQLRATAGLMASYRDLPMGRHDIKAMSSPQVQEAFERFVTLEEQLVAVLHKRLEQDRTILVQMVGTGERSGPRS